MPILSLPVSWSLSFPISNEIHRYTSLRGTKPFKLKFRTNRGLVLALVAPLSASCSWKTYISSLLECEILLRKPYAANQRGENIDMHFLQITIEIQFL